MKWLADENLTGAIVRGLVRRSPRFDILRVQDIPEISGAGDPAVLVWAARNDRILLTQDVSTMIPAMRETLSRGWRCSLIVLVPDTVPINVAIEDLLLLDDCSTETDWVAGVLYLPLR